MKGIGDYLNLHATALTVRAKRNKVLASNIANAATPNFKARDIDFQALINRSEGVGPLRTTDGRHFKVSMEASGNRMQYRTPVNPARDGNTVEMNVEQMEFSENTMRYQTTLTFLNNKIAGLKSAIRGE
ncbi:MAG: flagellar basal body rod protein FlgB [Candidatus Puniceispirillaceae bacterium]|jgi:flagellar basal-body rod protein FlgB